jgi:hypothetical protein
VPDGELDAVEREAAELLQAVEQREADDARRLPASAGYVGEGEVPPR